MIGYCDGHATAKHLAALTIEVGKFIESSNFQSGVSGWRIDDVTAELNDAIFRGQLAAASGTFAGNLTAATLDVDAGVVNLTNAFALLEGEGNVQVQAKDISNDGDLILTADRFITLGSPANPNTIRVGNNTLGFFNAAPAPRPTITGSRDANSALASLLAFLDALGLVVNSTTAS